MNSKHLGHIIALYLLAITKFDTWTNLLIMLLIVNILNTEFDKMFFIVWELMSELVKCKKYHNNDIYANEYWYEFHYLPNYSEF